MRKRGHIYNFSNFDSTSVDCADCGLSSITRTFDIYLYFSHSQIKSDFATIRGRHLSRIGGVFFDPLNPILPADDQEMTWPLEFVIEIMMLLKDECTCACPTASTLTSRFLLDVDFFAIIQSLINYFVAFFLLATVFFLPFLVRALFFVLCPLTGSPRRCLIPR